MLKVTFIWEKIYLDWEELYMNCIFLVEAEALSFPRSTFQRWGALPGSMWLGPSQEILVSTWGTRLLSLHNSAPPCDSLYSWIWPLAFVWMPRRIAPWWPCGLLGGLLSRRETPEIALLARCVFCSCFVNGWLLCVCLW